MVHRVAVRIQFVPEVGPVLNTGDALGKLSGAGHDTERAVGVPLALPDRALREDPVIRKAVLMSPLAWVVVLDLTPLVGVVSGGIVAVVHLGRGGACKTKTAGSARDTRGEATPRGRAERRPNIEEAWERQGQTPCGRRPSCVGYDRRRSGPFVPSSRGAGGGDAWDAPTITTRASGTSIILLMFAGGGVERLCAKVGSALCRMKENQKENPKKKIATERFPFCSNLPKPNSHRDGSLVVLASYRTSARTAGKRAKKLRTHLRIKSRCGIDNGAWSRCRACTGQRSELRAWRAGSAGAVAAKRLSLCVDSPLRFRHRGGSNGEPMSLDEQQAARTDLRGEGIGSRSGRFGSEPH